MKTGTTTVVFLAAIAISGVATGAPIKYSYSTSIGFDPSSTVGAGGENAAQLVDELFGPGIGSTGSATLSGSFTYNNAAPQFDGNNASAGYIAITDANVSLGGTSARANIDTIRANSSTSSVGFNAVGGGFCGSELGCQSVGLPHVATGNVVQVTNDTEFQIVNTGGTVEFTPRDALSFSIGGTDVQADFGPALSTETFGDVSVDLVSIGLISQQSPDFFDSVALPQDLSFLDDTDLEASIFEIVFSGPSLLDVFTLQGAITELANGDLDDETVDGDLPGGPGATDVPEPGSLFTLAFGLAWLVAFVAVRRRQI
ncbi:hypothetical protein GCM10028792_32190 [Salinisphaera aquimarina]